MTHPALRIGITIGLRSADESLWINGIKQNAVFLAEALKSSALVQSVWLVNTTQVTISSSLPWDLKRWPTVRFEDVKDTLDVLIELGGQIDAEQTDYLKSRGTRLVSYCCGVEYIQAMESILFNKPLWGYNLFINQRYDAVWVIPQVEPSSGPFFSILRRRPVTVVPFVWHPMFIEERSKLYADNGCYVPGNWPKRLSVMEPNLNVVKFCLYPILIAEEAQRRQPDAIGHLHVTNSEHLAKESKEFIALMNHLDMVRNHKVRFVGNYSTPQFLSEMTDIVISHQWENALNYFYLEVCWQGYPLVHNAHLVFNLGYYYPGNDVHTGSARLLEAIAHHDDNAATYRARQRKLIARFLPDNPLVIQQYESLLTQLMASPIV